MKRIVIIGAGPSGLAAACAALSAGAHVTLVDEAERAGGQFWRHHPKLTNTALQHGWRRFDTFMEVLRTATQRGRLEHLSDTAVWRVDAGDGIALHVLTGPVDSTNRTGSVIHADALILATGAYDRALPVPGWTLPGVVTAGAAQALAKRDGVTPGQRTVVAGAGPFLLPVAQSIQLVGGRVEEIAEASARSTILRGWGARPWELAASTAKAGELGEYFATLLRHRIPYRLGWGVVRIHGNRSVEGVTLARLDRDWAPVSGTERHVDCDSVALGHGFTPRLEAAIQAGCNILPNRFVQVDDDQRTSVPDVFAAGELTGIGGSDLAMQEGAIAGLVAAGSSSGGAVLAKTKKKRSQLQRFADRLTAAHSIGPKWTSWLDGETVLCRCESATVASVRAFASESERSRRLATRATLGACQGRTCGRSVEDVVAAAGGGVAGSSPDKRAFLSPIRLGELAVGHDLDD